ncbi:MAG: hypothetical protein H0V29_04450 [Thermoleophilaceae bacterium]|nr:hypothetical protein [Thermoleophilaceae bacterium]
MAARILVVANETCPCPALLDEIARIAGEDSEVLVIAPALNTRLRHYVSDTDAAFHAAEERLALAVESLRERGVESRAEVGDADPLVAIEDSLAGFEADDDRIESRKCYC